MEKLIAKIAAYERCVQGLLDRIKEFETFVIENVPHEFRSDLNVHNFWGEYCVHQDGNIIPTNIDKCGHFAYWGGDFNRPFTRASRKQVVEFAKSLPKLIEKAEKLAEKRLTEVENL